MPAEFNEFLPKDCDEYKRWKASKEAGVSGAMAGLTVGGEAVGEAGAAAPTPAAPAQEKKSSKKKKGKPEVVLERNTRNKKKCITTITGLDTFGVKLGEASKLFGKKFASGASVVKNAEGKEHIDVQAREPAGAAGSTAKRREPSRGRTVHTFAPRPISRCSPAGRLLGPGRGAHPEAVQRGDERRCLCD